MNNKTNKHKVSLMGRYTLMIVSLLLFSSSSSSSSSSNSSMIMFVFALNTYPVLSFPYKGECATITTGRTIDGKHA